MASALRLADLRTDIDGAVEIVPPHAVSDAEILVLQERYAPLSFERFADGTLLVTPPAGFRSGARNLELARQVANWIRAYGGIGSDSSGGFTLPDTSLFAADATYVSPERWSAASSATFPTLVPDAVFELMSQSDRLRTTRKKIVAYLRNGVRLVVLLDPWQRRVFAGHEHDPDVHELDDVATFDCAPVMPGFVLDVSAIFASP
jgi:Uma2 family endonuclease